MVVDGSAPVKMFAHGRMSKSFFAFRTFFYVMLKGESANNQSSPSIQGLVKGAKLCLNPNFFGWLEK